MPLVGLRTAERSSPVAALRRGTPALGNYPSATSERNGTHGGWFMAHPSRIVLGSLKGSLHHAW